MSKLFRNQKVQVSESKVPKLFKNDVLEIALGQ